jgi:hypothetical protein
MFMNTNKNYKASLFSMLFNEPDKMLEIYNALTGNNLPPDTSIEPATLENVLFMDRINDVAFVVDGKLIVLIEHQSTINKNMPLRLLIYVARVYEKLIDSNSVYKSKLLKIPKPEFYVLYNGPHDCVDYSTLRLSDAFMDCPYMSGFRSFLELEVPVININKGHNIDMIQRSEFLNGYVLFVAKVREFKALGSDDREAVISAIKYCVENDILADVLSRISPEVISMLAIEFNLEDAQKVWREEGIEEGIEKGIEKGRVEMIRRMKRVGGMSLEQIAQLTGLPVSDIEKLDDAGNETK